MTMRPLPILLLMFSCLVFGQGLNSPNKLPPCPTDQNQRFHNCWGMRILNEGGRYVGEYKDDKMHGLGTYRFSDGNQYVGNFKKDKKQGEGVLYTPGGKVNKSGLWKNDQFSSRANLNLDLYAFQDESSNSSWLDLYVAENFFSDSYGWAKSNFFPYFSNAYKSYKKNTLIDFLLLNWKYTCFLLTSLIISLRIIRFISIRLDPFCTRCFADLNHVDVKLVEENRWVELIDWHTSQEVTDQYGNHTGYINTPAKVESELRSATEYYHCRECGKKWSTYYPVLGLIGNNSPHKHGPGSYLHDRGRV
jgi:hypothetical protein